MTERTDYEARNDPQHAFPEEQTDGSASISDTAYPEENPDSADDDYTVDYTYEDDRLNQREEHLGMSLLKTLNLTIQEATGSFSTHVDNARERTHHLSDDARDLTSQIFEAIDRRYKETAERVREHAVDAGVVDSICESVEEGYVPHLFSSLVSEAIGFNAFPDDEQSVLLMRQESDSAFFAIPDEGCTVRIESYDSAEADTQPPELRRWLAHRFGFLVQPLGTSRREIHPGHWIYATVYPDCFIYGPEGSTETDPESETPVKTERLKSPATLTTLFTLHNAHVHQEVEEHAEFSVDMLPSYVGHLYEIFDSLQSEARVFGNEKAHDKVSEALDLLDSISTQNSEQTGDSVLLGDSLDSAVFREFVGSVANVDTLYSGPAFFDLGYLVHLLGISEDTDEIRNLLFHYNIGSRAADPQRVEQLTMQSQHAAHIFDLMEDLFDELEEAFG